MIFLKQSTAVTIPYGPFVDETDGVTAETGLTLTQPDIQLSKNGGTFAQKSAAQTLSHMTLGHYGLSLSTTDTNTLGHLRIATKETGAAPVWMDCIVLAADVYDAWFGSALQSVNVTQFGGAAGTFASGRPEVNTSHAAGTAWGSGAITAGVIATDAIGSAELATTAIDEIAAAVWSYTLRNLTFGGAPAVQSSADSGSTTTLVDNNLTQSDTDYWKGAIIKFVSGNIQGQARIITGFNPGTDTITFAPAVTQAVSAQDYEIWYAYGLEESMTRSALGLAAANLDAQLSAIANFIDTEITDILSRLPAALTAGGNMKSDALAISGSTTAADNLEQGALGLVASTCASGSTTTSIVTNLTEATNDHFKDRWIFFTGGALLGQAKKITAYDGGTKTLTIEAATEAPANTDPFVIA